MIDTPHDHTFGQDARRPAERRAVIVAAITAATMIVEVVGGLVYGSMALLADGLHMGSHAAALGLAAIAYVYARRRAGDERFCFGTGKVNALAGFTGAIALAGFALLMAGESVGRLLHPVRIAFDQAIVVAFGGLIVNGISLAVLRTERSGTRHHHPPHGTSGLHAHHEDHNLRSAYLHVLADALTSVLAIAALAAGRFLGASWLDPAMGVAGASLVVRWAWALLRQSGRILLDHQAPSHLRLAIVEALEVQGAAQVTDLHVWSIGPGYYAAEIALIAGHPRSPDDYRSLLPTGLGLAHVTVEVSAIGNGSGLVRRQGIEPRTY